ncbi:unnamed protein product [Urochloa humidicola]
MEKFYYKDSRSFFVEIEAISDVKDGNRTEEVGWLYTGVVLFCHPKFAYIIVHHTCLSESSNPSRVQLTFPDQTQVVVAIGDVRRILHNFVVIGCVPKDSFDTAVVKAVEFDEKKLAMGASVHTLSMVDFVGPADLTSGAVGRTEDSFFYHGCRVGSYTKFGSPVFNDNAQFVGLCYGAPCGILAACTVRSIAKNLAYLYGTVDMGIKEVLQKIYERNMPKDVEQDNTRFNA